MWCIFCCTVFGVVCMFDFFFPPLFPPRMRKEITKSNYNQSFDFHFMKANTFIWLLLLLLSPPPPQLLMLFIWCVFFFELHMHIFFDGILNERLSRMNYMNNRRYTMVSGLLFANLNNVRFIILRTKYSKKKNPNWIHTGKNVADFVAQSMKMYSRSSSIYYPNDMNDCDRIG